MADNKKYYYLKLKDNFFDSDEMIILENMPDGYLYSNILLKLYLRSLKNEGKLMFNDRIPFNSTMLAQVTRHSVGVIEKAMRIFQELNLVEVLDNGAIYMLDIQNFIGESSTEADRKRVYRARIEKDKTKLQLPQGQMSDKCPDKSTPELEIEIEIEKEIEIEESEQQLTKKDIQTITNTWNSLGLQQLKAINPGTNRHSMLRARIKEYSLDEILQAIESVKNSSFLKGQNKNNWMITFDWFIKPNNFVKVLEGNYLDKEVSNGKSTGNDNKNTWNIEHLITRVE